MKINIRVLDTEDNQIYEFADYEEMALELSKWLNLEILSNDTKRIKGGK